MYPDIPHCSKDVVRYLDPKNLPNIHPTEKLAGLGFWAHLRSPNVSERYLKWRVHPHRDISCMDTAYGGGSFPTPKIAENKVQETIHFRYRRCLVIMNYLNI